MNIFKRHPLPSWALVFVTFVLAVWAALHHHAYTLTGSYTARFPPVDSLAAGSFARLALHADGTAELVSRAPGGEHSSASAQWILRGDDLLLSVKANAVASQSYFMQAGTHVYRRAPGELTAVGLERDGHLAAYGLQKYPQPVSFTFRRDFW